MTFKIVFTTGGTGGHMYPALCVAQALKSQGHIPYIFTDTRGQAWLDNGMENRVYEDTIPVLSRSVVGRGIVGKCISLAMMCKGVFVARTALKKLQVSAVVGFGGFASFPVVLAGMSLGIPIFLHEQNAYAGRVNRLLSPFVKRIATSFTYVQGLPEKKCVFTGNPVRSDIAKLYNCVYTPPVDKVHILITGGSQGAKVFGDIIPSVLTKYGDKIRIIHQVRKEQLDTVEKYYKQHAMDVHITPFIDDMAGALQWAHIAIARSGAGTVMENACAGLPTIFVPYKYASDNHQYYNAKASRGGVIVEQSDNMENLLQNQLDSFIVDTRGYARLMTLSTHAKQDVVVGAENRIAHMILQDLIPQQD